MMTALRTIVDGLSPETWRDAMSYMTRPNVRQCWEWGDAGRGTYEYKVQMGGEEESLENVFLLRDQISSHVRLSGLLAASNAIDLLYYRVWLRWIGPRFGPHKCPLWCVWIGTRL